MEVIKIIEQEDGGAIIELDMTEEEKELLIGYAIRDIIKRSIEEGLGDADIFNRDVSG